MYGARSWTFDIVEGSISAIQILLNSAVNDEANLPEPPNFTGLSNHFHVLFHLLTRFGSPNLDFMNAITTFVESLSSSTSEHVSLALLSFSRLMADFLPMIVAIQGSQQWMLTQGLLGVGMYWIFTWLIETRQQVGLHSLTLYVAPRPMNQVVAVPPQDGGYRIHWLFVVRGIVVVGALGVGVIFIFPSVRSLF